MPKKITTKPEAVQTYTLADIEAARAAGRKEGVEKFKADKQAKRDARSTLGFHPMPVDSETSEGFNLLAKCVFVAEDIGAIDAAVVFARGGGFRVSSAVGACFGVQGDTATGDTVGEALDNLERAMTDKVAAFVDEMRKYLDETATAALDAGRTYREKPKAK